MKKANQKRHLGDVAIEGGNFTTAFFRQQAIKDLFEEPTGLQSLVEEKEAASKQREEKEVASSKVVKPNLLVESSKVEDQLEKIQTVSEEESPSVSNVTKTSSEQLTIEQLEQVMSVLIMFFEHSAYYI